MATISRKALRAETPGVNSAATASVGELKKCIEMKDRRNG